MEESSSDPLAGPFGSSPPPTTSIDMGELPNGESTFINQNTIEYISPEQAAQIYEADSSDPLGMATLQNFSAPPLRLPNSGTRKRGPCHSDQSDQQPCKEPRIDNIQQPISLSKELVYQARDLLVKACSLTSSRSEQSKLLDLIEIFREYTEKGVIQKTSSILAT